MNETPQPPVPPEAPGPPAGEPYPVTFDVRYPDRELNRVSTGFRILAAIPIAVVLAAIGGGYWWDSYAYGAGAGGILFLPVLLMILFREKYPRWWFDWNRELLRFANRVGAYVLLLDDRYPSTDEQQYVRLELEYPDVPNELNRWLPLVKWFLAIPHYVVLLVLHIGVLFAVIGAWFAILFTGRYPRGIFDFVVGVMRWTNRVGAYAFALVTDRYPPFRLAP
ncbi:MAG: hypothetical protein JWN32_1444 [Solirubrobacterales bacterium]|nr:hypothetical protein [Solirubrobacterales bacterium]